MSRLLAAIGRSRLRAGLPSPADVLRGASRRVASLRVEPPAGRCPRPTSPRPARRAASRLRARPAARHDDPRRPPTRRLRRPSRRLRPLTRRADTIPTGPPGPRVLTEGRARGAGQPRGTAPGRLSRRPHLPRHLRRRSHRPTDRHPDRAAHRGPTRAGRSVGASGHPVRGGRRSVRGGCHPVRGARQPGLVVGRAARHRHTTVPHSHRPRATAAGDGSRQPTTAARRRTQVAPRPDRLDRAQVQVAHRPDRLARP